MRTGSDRSDDDSIAPLSPNAWLRFELIREALEDVPARARVLEVGCGQGAIGVRMARRFDYTGVEQDEVSADTARERLDASGVDYRLLVGDFGHVPLDPPYDVVCAFEVLEHIEDDRGALSEWSKLLRPGGMILLSVPAWQKRFAAADDMAGHYRRYDPENLARLLGEIGLEDVIVRMYGFPLGFALEAGRNLLARRESRREGSLADRTASSGRLFQPGQRLGRMLGPATYPFRRMQGLSSRLGTGLVATATRSP